MLIILFTLFLFSVSKHHMTPSQLSRLIRKRHIASKRKFCKRHCVISVETSSRSRNCAHVKQCLRQLQMPASAYLGYQHFLNWRKSAICLNKRSLLLDLISILKRKSVAFNRCMIPMCIIPKWTNNSQHKDLIYNIANS